MKRSARYQLHERGAGESPGPTAIAISGRSRLVYQNNKKIITDNKL